MRYLHISDLKNSIKTGWDLGVWGTRGPPWTSWVPHFLCIAQKLHLDPIRGKSDWQPELLLLDFLLPHQDLSLLQARFLLVHAALLFLPLKKSLWRKLMPWGTPPGGTIDLSKPSSRPLRALNPQSPSLLRFLSPLKFHVQYGSGVYLKDQQPLFLFLVSKISPGVWLLSLHKQGSFYSLHRPWWDLELWPCTQVFFTHFLEIKDPSPAYQLFLTSNIKDQFRSLSWQCNLTAYERVPNFQAPKTHWPPLLHLSKFVLSIQQWQVILFQWDLYITQVTSQWYPDTHLLPTKAERKTHVSSGNILTCKPFPV